MYTKCMKVVFVMLIILALGGVAFVAYRFLTPAANFSCASASKKPVIVAFGDSLVAGYGATEQQGFVGPLSVKIGLPIINDGEDGDTTAQGLARLPGVIAQKPDIVILLLGGNDALQKVPLETTKANLQQIISTLQQNHIQAVLVGVIGGFPIDSFASMYQDLANQYKVKFVPNILSGLIGNTKYMYDEVHPNAAGYDIATEKIYPVLNQACQAIQL